MTEYRRLSNESIDEFGIRLAVNKEIYSLTWEDIAEILNKENNENFTESKYRKYLSPFIEGYEYALGKKLEDKEILDELELKKLEAQRELQKMRTVRSEVVRMNRETARAELFTEEMVEAVKKMKPINVPKEIVKFGTGEKGHILFFGDSHYGKDIIIEDIYGNIMNEYNPEIFEERMWRLLEETKDIIKKENIKYLKVVDLGDSIEGMIRVSQLANLRYGVADSTINYTNFLVQWLNKLTLDAKIYIDFYSCFGNHDDLRLISGKKGDFPHENVGKFITWGLGLALSDNKNININDAHKDGFAYFECAGFDIFATHGADDKNFESAIKDYMMFYDANIDYLVGGHKHTSDYSDVAIMKGVIRVRSIMGVEDFAKKIKKCSSAGASLIIFEEGYGKKVTYDIVLN